MCAPLCAAGLGERAQRRVRSEDTWEKGPRGDRAPTCPLRLCCCGLHELLHSGRKRRSNEAAEGVEHDIKLLVEGIKRLGSEKNGEISTTFGEIFKDEVLEQQLESLVGSLKAAKKRGILMFEGQMLLQGAHDHVVITLKNAS